MDVTSQKHRNALLDIPGSPNKVSQDSIGPMNNNLELVQKKRIKNYYTGTGVQNSPKQARYSQNFKDASKNSKMTFGNDKNRKGKKTSNL